MSYGSEDPVPVVGCLLARRDILRRISERIDRHFFGAIGSGILATSALGIAVWLASGIYSRGIANEFEASDVLQGSFAFALLTFAVSRMFAARNRYKNYTAATDEYDKEAARPTVYW